ncbi:hypothetical protein GCM10008083_16800 [Ulvibacter litoralis]|nr:hypothetical protein GCM10008083_16800 [Ulvibacter litoralis]
MFYKYSEKNDAILDQQLQNNYEWKLRNVNWLVKTCKQRHFSKSKKGTLTNNSHLRLFFTLHLQSPFKFKD